MLALALALALAGPLDEGVALYQSLEFEKATIFFQKVALASDTAPATRAEAFLWLGLAYGQLGDTDSARDSFHRAMVSDDTQKAPPDTPPALATMLEEERRAVMAAKPAPPKPKPPTTTPKPPQTTTAAPAHTDPPAGTSLNVAALWSGIGAGVLGLAALGAGGFALDQLAFSYDETVPAKPALAAYDTAVTCGVLAGALGGAAVVAGGVSALLFAVE